MAHPFGTTTDFLARVFGPVTEGDVYVCSLPNERGMPGQPGEKYLRSRDMGEIAGFCTKWDRPGRGLFFCVGTLRPDAVPTEKGSYRTKDNVSEMHVVHSDIDLKDITIPLGEVVVRLRHLPLRPSIIVMSGHGVHAYWLLKEGLGQEHREAIEAALKQLADLVGGDLQVAECSRLMRLPGTHNTKAEAWTEVVIVEADYDLRYDLVQLEEMLAELSPIIERRESKAHTRNHISDNPFLAVAARFGFKAPIDVEQRLAAMAFKGNGDAAIHATQLSVTAALLTRGTPADDVVGIVLEATRAAAGPFGERWNWRREERTVREMCEGWVRKNPTVRPLLRGEARNERQDAQEELAAATGTDGPGATVHKLDSRKPRVSKPKGSAALSIVVADGVIETIRKAGRDIILSEGELWLYADGLWSAASPADEQWLRTLIQSGCDALGASGDTKAANAAWKRLTEHPELFQHAVEWDRGDTIAVGNGMLDLRTREFGPHAPSYYARKKIGTDYRPGRHCPKFLQFLAWCFVNREAADGLALVDVIKDAFGAMLAIRTLSREQRKALLLLGPSRTGKTQLATIARRMIGDPVAAPSIADLSKEFGLQALYGARAWIRDDAVNEGDILDAGRFKTVVTGERVDVNRKGKPYITVSFEMPVLLTANAMPRARDATDAIYNRSIVLEMTNEVSEERAAELSASLGYGPVMGLAEAMFEEEGPGILNWALEGLDRLREHGRYHLPECVRTSVQHFKDSNNPIGEWARTALRLSAHGKVSNSDLSCSYHGWQKEEHGDDAKAVGGKYLKTRLRTMFPSVDVDVKSMGTRYIGGLALTDEGLALWDRHRDDPLRTGSKGSSTTRHEVNKLWKIHLEGQGGAGETHF